MPKSEIDKLRKEYFDVCDRIYLNEKAQQVRGIGKSKQVEEQIEKDKARRDELERIMDS